MAITLTGKLSGLAVGGAVSKQQGTYVIADTLEMTANSKIDTNLIVQRIHTPTNITGVEIGVDDANGQAVPISVEIYGGQFGNGYNDSQFANEQGSRITLKNVAFHLQDVSSSIFGLWPGAVTQTTNTIDAENVTFIAYTNLSNRTIKTSGSNHLWLAGGGNLKDVSFVGFNGVFFNYASLSAVNVNQPVDTGQRGISVASSGIAPVPLKRTILENANTQQPNCLLKLIDPQFTGNYIRNGAGAGTSILEIWKSLGGIIQGATSDALVKVWDTDNHSTVLTSNYGTNLGFVDADEYRVYRNSTTATTAANIETGVGVEAGT